MNLQSLIEYMKIHLISLEQDGAYIQKQMDEYQNYEDDEYKDLEIEDISNTGQIIGIRYILDIAEGRI